MVGKLTGRKNGLPRIVNRFETEMENALERFFGPRSEWETPEAFTPRTNVAETDASIEATVELPGLKPEDVKVELHGKELWISGEKKTEKEEKGKEYHRIERSYGEFHRAIPLTMDVVADKIEAVFRNGVLTVTVPKAEAVKPKTIEVKA